jgi:DUF917 family protein
VWTLNLDALSHLRGGAKVLGSGGGGDVFSASLMVHQALEDHGPIPIVSLDELPDDAQLATVAVIGAPTVMMEKIPSGRQLKAVMDALIDHLGHPIDAVLPIVVGGMNTFIPLALAAELSLPCVDADGMRRTLQQVDMTTFTLGGIAASPMSEGDEKGNIILFDTVSNKVAAELARRSAMSLGLACVLASYPMTAAQAKSAAVRNSLSYCLEVGTLLEAVQHNPSDAWPEFLHRTGARIIYDGRIMAVDRQTTYGFARGSFTIEALADTSSTLRIEAQNEFLLAIEDGQVVITPPDLICVLDLDNAEPLGTDDLVCDQRVRVLALPSAPEWRRPGALGLVGPQAFGYNVTPVPFARGAR